MTIWVLVVAVMNVVTRRFVRRSVARLEAGIDGEESVAAEPGSGIGKLLLDPVSERLYQSLEEVLHRQRERNEQVSSRLHHTERLASLGQLAAGLAAAWFCATVVLALLGFADGEIVCDDAYYYFEIARNAALGEGFTFDSDPEAWSIVDDRLYLNFDKPTRALWRTNNATLVVEANRYWPAVLR